MLRSGAHWHDLPERYGKYKTVHKRFTRWAKAGVWETAFDHLVQDPDNDYVALDSSLVRAATGKDGSQKGDQALGRSRGGLTTKSTWPPMAEGCPSGSSSLPASAPMSPRPQPCSKDSKLAAFSPIKPMILMHCAKSSAIWMPKLSSHAIRRVSIPSHTTSTRRNPIRQAARQLHEVRQARRNRNMARCGIIVRTDLATPRTAATLITSNLPFDEWTETLGSERLIDALLDRITHQVNIREMNGDNYRLAQSRARKAG